MGCSVYSDLSEMGLKPSLLCWKIDSHLPQKRPWRRWVSLFHARLDLKWLRLGKDGIEHVLCRSPGNKYVAILQAKLRIPVMNGGMGIHISHTMSSWGLLKVSKQYDS